jgi:hypothetical protein
VFAVEWALSRGIGDSAPQSPSGVSVLAASSGLAAKINHKQSIAHFSILFNDLAADGRL